MNNNELIWSHNDEWRNEAILKIESTSNEREHVDRFRRCYFVKYRISLSRSLSQPSTLLGSTGKWNEMKYLLGHTFFSVWVKKNKGNMISRIIYVQYDSLRIIIIASVNWFTFTCSQNYTGQKWTTTATKDCIESKSTKWPKPMPSAMPSSNGGSIVNNRKSAHREPPCSSLRAKQKT